MESGGTVEMIECKKYGVSMLASNADATCAQRFEISLNDNDTLHNFDKCRTCRRGAIMYELKKHEAPDRYRFGSLIRINTQGETNMAKITKKCDTHGDYETNRSNGRCPECLKSKGGKAATAKARRTRREPRSVGRSVGDYP